MRAPAFVWWKRGRVTHIRDGGFNAVCGHGGHRHHAHMSRDLHDRPLCTRCVATAIKRGHRWLNLARGVG